MRFTPDSYSWRWGDGTSNTFSAPGSTWESLGQARLTETPTSHVYERRGAVTVGLDIGFSVEFRLGEGPWTRVEGSVAGAAADVPVFVGTATTVIVPGDCRSDPAGAGC